MTSGIILLGGVILVGCLVWLIVLVFRHMFRAQWTRSQAAQLQCIMVKIPHAGVSKS